MANYFLETITAAQALSYNAATEQLAFQDANASASQVTVLYIPAAGADPARVSLTYNGVTKIFGTGIYGENDFFFTNGSVLFVGDPAGGETQSGASAMDGLYGGDGADSLAGLEGANFIQGNAGNDTTSAGSSADVIYGGQGDDQLAG